MAKRSSSEQAAGSSIISIQFRMGTISACWAYKIALRRDNIRWLLKAIVGEEMIKEGSCLTPVATK